MISFFWKKIKVISTGKQQNKYDGSFISDLNWLASRGVDSCLIYSEGSLSLDIFKATCGEMVAVKNISDRLFVDIIQSTDHVFTLYWSQKYLIDLLRRWIDDEQRVWKTGRADVAGREKNGPGE
jgi:hypothetical protein